MSIAKTALVSLFALALAGPAAFAAEKPHAKPARAVIKDLQALGPGAIDRFEAVELGGLKQWISVRGTNPDNPILLFLHGGPGSAEMGQAWTFQRPWEDFFTVVQWDQRGAGKTFAESQGKPDPSQTLGRMQQDTEELIQLLMRTYGKKKIFVLGHSFGSILGLSVARDHPDWLYAYIGVGQVVNAQQNEVVGYQETLAVARSLGNAQAVGALEALAPYPDAAGGLPLMKIAAERHWDVALGGMRFGRNGDDDTGRESLSPLYNAKDGAAGQAAQVTSLQALLPQLAGIDFTGTTSFQCPIFFFAGADDRTTPRSLVEAYFPHIEAPQKKLFVVKRAAHYVFDEAPGEFLVDLVRDIRPLATAAGD